MFYPFIFNPFPELLTFSLLSATILRVVVGILFVRYGYLGLQNKDSLNSAISWVQIIGGLLLVLGLYTQIAAIVLLFIVLHKWARDKKNVDLSQEKSDLYILLFVVCLSLLVTGAGFFGFDLPL